MDGKALAVWDFETLHDAVMESDYGPNWFRRFSGDNQPPAINVPAIARAVEEITPDNWHTALADWRFFGNYAATLHENKVRPVQIFPGRGDVAEQIRQHHSVTLDQADKLRAIDRVVLIGLDDSQCAFVKQLKEVGTAVTGIGISQDSNQLAIADCDDFIDYYDLSPATSTASPGARAGAREVLVQAIQDLSQRFGNEWVQRVRIKPTMVTIDADFDEAKLGYKTFSDFLADNEEVLFSRHVRTAREPEYALRPDHRLDPTEHLEPGEKELRLQVTQYNHISAREGLRLPEAKLMWLGVDIYAAFLSDPTGFANFKELDEECLTQLKRDISGASMTDAKKVRQVLFKCFLFSPGTGEKIGFQKDIKTLPQVEDLYFNLIINRVARKVKGLVNFKALSLTATGESKYSKRLSVCFDTAPQVL
ncbi:hypothetical protein [Neolewinella antarctica]|uniref:NYN domain-containing protein n=1 Tax=Neolewinella antarctica TaxID=442734 RepID=A0ABX0X7P1_9BACT|nr:hypothetical protein [Neolewinella antarctica]NJC25238.1 hypothetical protein [Neolewinella antarctica]